MGVDGEVSYTGDRRPNSKKPKEYTQAWYAHTHTQNFSLKNPD